MMNISNILLVISVISSEQICKLKSEIMVLFLLIIIEGNVYSIFSKQILYIAVYLKAITVLTFTIIKVCSIKF